MTEHEPGRALDVMVHRALWPEDAIVVSDFVQSYRRTIGANPYSEVWSTIPFYSTDITAWDWTRIGWEWTAEEVDASKEVDVFLKTHNTLNSDGDPWQSDIISAFYADHSGSSFRAQAYLRCLCVLEWAEAKEASDAKA